MYFSIPLTSQALHLPNKHYSDRNRYVVQHPIVFIVRGMGYWIDSVGSDFLKSNVDKEIVKNLTSLQLYT